MRQRTFVPCSTTRSRKASTGWSPPRSRPTCPNDLPTTDSSGQATIWASSRDARPAPRNVESYSLRERGGTPRPATAHRAPPNHAGAVPPRPEPNSSKTTRSMPSAYTSNGTGRCHRKSAERLTSRATGRGPQWRGVRLDVRSRQQTGASFLRSIGSDMPLGKSDWRDW